MFIEESITKFFLKKNRKQGRGIREIHGRGWKNVLTKQNAATGKEGGIASEREGTATWWKKPGCY